MAIGVYACVSLCKLGSQGDQLINITHFFFWVEVCDKLIVAVDLKCIADVSYFTLGLTDDVAVTSFDASAQFWMTSANSPSATSF